MDQPGEHGNREKLRKLYEVLKTGRVDELDEIMSPDVVTDYPQSGERLAGIENIKAMIANYPGGALQLNEDEAVVVGDEEHYMITPTFNVVKVQGGGDTLVGSMRSRYPDVSIWYVISITHFHDGKIVRAQQFFAPEFEAPEWRAQWVQRM
jgi:ketosteroid isomerase-like protein